MFDIDIDFADRSKVLKLLPHIKAMRLENSRHIDHLTGIYITDIPNDVINNRATISYKEAEKRGYFKIDFLNLHIYDKIRDYDHYFYLLNKEPKWELLLNAEFCRQVIHIGSYHNIISMYTINSIERMAMLLALIRPAKKHLIGKVWELIESEIWDNKDQSEYFFKKSHAIAYSHAVAIHINLLEESSNFSN